MPENRNQSLNKDAEQTRGVRVSAEQEMLSETDQADLDTTLHGMNIPLEDESEQEDSSLPEPAN